MKERELKPEVSIFMDGLWNARPKTVNEAKRMVRKRHRKAVFSLAHPLPNDVVYWIVWKNLWDYMNLADLGSVGFIVGNIDAFRENNRRRMKVV